MAIKMIENEWCPYEGDYRRSYIIDSAAEIADLPTSCPGSVAVVANKDGAVYMVNASGQWKEM